ncbi:MAG: tandem-95 repeat protein [Rhodobacterales bacterium]|nr:tandem-95 repeat protein [Rhodobacterales bacterium]
MRPIVAFLALAACHAEPPAPFSAGLETAPADFDPSDPDYRSGELLANLSPLYYGQNTIFEVTGAVPGETVYFVYSLAGAGPGQCPPPLGGLCLGVLDPINVFAQVVADGVGTASIELAVPASGPDDLPVWFQAGMARGAGGVDSVLTNVLALNANFDNTSPIAANDNFNIDEDIVLSPLASLFDNDTDADGDTLTAVPGTPATNGELVVNVDGTFTYTPAANFAGVDSFTYQVYDGIALSNIAMVTITVNAVNDAPQGGAENYAGGVIEDTIYVSAAGEEVLSNDGDIEGDAIEAVLETEPTCGGTVALNLDGSFTYTPGLDFSGNSFWQYRARDTFGALSEPITVTMNVTARNDSPVTVGEAYATGRDEVLNEAAPGVLAIDTDVDGPFPLTAAPVLIAQPDNGTVAIAADGGFVYTPDLCYIGADSFDYRAADANNSNSNASTVSLDVGASALDDPAYCDAYVPVVLSFEYDEYLFQGVTTLSYVPANPVGLVFYFHGSGGSVANIHSPNNDELWNELVSRGYGIVATSATNGGDWDTSTNNASNNDDWPRLSAIRDDLIVTTDVTTSTPIVGIGASLGGWFVGENFSTIALNEGWPYSVTSTRVAAPLSTPNNVPMFFFGSFNDHMVDVSDVVAAYNNHVGTKAYVEHAEEVLHPMRFMRIDGFNHQLSQDHFDELIAMGGIDSAGNRLVSTAQISSFLNTYEATSTLNRVNQVTSLLKVVWARHRYSALFHIQEADFIDANL